MLHPLQLDVLKGSRVGAVAVEQDELGSPLLKEMDCGLDFLTGAHPCRQNQWFASLAELIDQRQIGQIGRSDLVGGYSKRLQNRNAALIPRGAKIENAFFLAIIRKKALFFDTQFKAFQQIGVEPNGRRQQ